MRCLLIIAGLLPFFVCAQVDHARYVNPFIGTGGHGHTFPGAVVPFGMVQLSPDTRIDGSWDGCSGYHYSDEYIYGFSHTHLSGTGCSDYGDILFMPYTGKVVTGSKEYRSTFSHKNEKAEPGFYSVKLGNGVKAALTATTRAGFHQYTFPDKEARIILDLTHRDKTLGSQLRVVDNTHIEGMRRSEAWARDQYVYFVAEFSQPFSSQVFVNGQLTQIKQSDNYTGTDVKAVFSFKTKRNGTVYVRVGISNVSIEGARKNLEAEIPHWDFEKTKTEARAAWNKELGKIETFSSDEDKRTVFYSALYHCMIHPGTASDVDGQYRGRDNKIHRAEGFTYYTVFSLWDTFRALHPLFTIIDKKRTSDFIRTMLAQYEQAGVLPVWELSSNETWCMIGYHAVSVMADAYAKGIRDFDTRLALEAMRKSAGLPQFGIDVYSMKHYLEKEDEHESVSKTLEYAYDDWCIASFAQNLGDEITANEFFQRSLSWRNLFDSRTGFIRPRSNGGWLEPFEPREVNNNYTEANAWQYTFFVPHDIDGLIGCMGGKQKFATRLDELFAASSKTLGREQSDITGLIGQYAHGNEPSHHMAYLYDFAGQPWKTQQRVRQISDEFYKNAPDGLIGNEDCGQMSAWYVFSALGFYPVCPGNTQYALGTPAFEKTVIHLENGKTFSIEAENLSSKNFYIKNPPALFITHQQVEQGGKLVLQMTNLPQTGETYPVSALPHTGVISSIVPAPVFGGNKVFYDSTQVELYAPAGDSLLEWYYTFTDPGCRSDTCVKPEYKYMQPFTIRHSTVIWAYGRHKYTRQRGNITRAYFHKFPNNWAVQIRGRYNPQYTAGGDNGIIDGLKGDENWRKGGWQGYQGQDFECVVDLRKETRFSTIHTTFLQDQRSWIIMPVKVEYAYSLDGETWTPYATVTNTLDPKDEKVQVRDFSTGLGHLSTARYIRVKAVNFGRLPEWHQGYGMGDAFIFVDEISVE